MAKAAERPLSVTFTRVTTDVAAAMPEFALLSRSARARGWLSELWDPSSGPCPDGPPLDPTALAGGVAMERVVRFPAAAPAGPGEGNPSFLPGDEADGSGLGPALAVMTVMGIPVEAPPLVQRRMFTAGGAAAAFPDVDSTVSADGVDVATFDEDDAVVPVRVVFDVHRDLLVEAALGVLSIPPMARGVLDRCTGEILTMFGGPAPPGSPVARVLMVEYACSEPDGGIGHTITTFGVDGVGRLWILARSRAVMTPATPPSSPPPAFSPSDGVTAVAAAIQRFSGSYGMAYAPCGPATTPAVSAAGALPEMLSFVFVGGPSSVAATFRLRQMAVSKLVPLLTPRALPDPPSSHPDGDGTGRRGDGDDGALDGRGGGRRGRRRRVDLAAVTSAAERARIVRNRAAAARCNAARKAARAAAHAAETGPDGRGEAAAKAFALAARGGLGGGGAAAWRLPALLPRP